MLDKLQYTWGSSNCVMVQMPTGTGKTHLLAAVVSQALYAAERPVWIIAHRRELVEQIVGTVAAYGIGVGERVRVFSIQWLARHWEELNEEPGLIIIDEAHHALAETYRELWLRFPRAKKLGMTATPCRLNRRGFTDLFDVLLCSQGIADFIREGYLAPFDYVSIRTDSIEQRLIDSLSKRGADGDFQIKEMDGVLNRRPSIERLHKSILQYAHGKKGIVYAISIGHARHIAAYYSRHGIRAAAIDSHTPAVERKRLVEDFRQGRLQVLVNVDVFSEGFDCPDVEFIQLARPTLSLAKYLQQVGRGLRKSADKQQCILIDNVGLYRLFGLPTRERDWQAMFEGRLAGKGCLTASKAYVLAIQNGVWEDETEKNDTGLEVIVSHDSLMELLEKQEGVEKNEETTQVKAFKDRQNGLWGLRRGQTVIVFPQYKKVQAIKGDFAIVNWTGGDVGIAKVDGSILKRFHRHERVKLLPDNLASVQYGDTQTYIDLLTGHFYPDYPKIRRFNQIELLVFEYGFFSRTKHVFRGRPCESGYGFLSRGYYLEIIDYFSSPDCLTFGGQGTKEQRLCILENDHSDYYRLSGRLPDGSIVIADRNGAYYHIGKDGGGREQVFHAMGTEEQFLAVVDKLRKEAEERLTLLQQKQHREQEQKCRNNLERLRRAVPFKSGQKWGLKLDDRIIIPPIYRNVQTPIGNYCAVEVYPCRWGVIMLDGKLIVQPKYTRIEIKDDGTALLTITPGKNVKMRL